MKFHACIAVCPVKYCNNANSEDHAVAINPGVLHRLWRVCEGLSAWRSHQHRRYVEVSRRFEQGQKKVAIVAPGIVANFPNDYIRINGRLRSKGVSAVFDVSFGAELTAKSYLHVLEKDKPQTLIAQPCPVVD